MTSITWIWLGAAGMIAVLCVVCFVQLKRCPSNRLLLVRNRLLRILGRDGQVYTHHGGVYFVWPLLQEYRFLDLSPMKVSVDLSDCLDRDVRNPSTYYFKACLDVDSDDERRYAGEQFWSKNREQIQQELKQRIQQVIQDAMTPNDGFSINEDRNESLVELEQILNQKLTDHGFRLLTISHKP